MINLKKYEIYQHEEFRDILLHHDFNKMETLNHHGGVSCMEHTLDVAEMTFQFAKRRQVDVISATRGALLHDFYLYDWHTDSPGFHGLKHPFIAARNAEKVFQLNAIERDAILRHMWPMIPIPPRYRESLLVSLVDKYVTIRDYAQPLSQMKGLPYHI